MRLTVGPLPPAVYWRRRLVVLVGLAMVVMIIYYACSGPAAPAPIGLSTTPTPTILRPVIGSPSPTSATSTAPSPTPTPSPSPSTPAVLTGPCTDDEIEIIVTPVNGPNINASGARFARSIRNIGSRTCERNIGGDVQELLIVRDGVVIWSSDDCQPVGEPFVKQFAPGESFTPTPYFWPGRRSRNGDGSVICPDLIQPQVEQAQPYEVVFRLDQKRSAPVALLVTS